MSNYRYPTATPISTTRNLLKYPQAISEFPCASVSKRVRNHSYENDFDLHENETTYRTHFHKKGFALRLVLKGRHKRIRKCPFAHALMAFFF